MRRLLSLAILLAPCAAPATEPEGPGLEVLEYLGQWQGEEGKEQEWMDPVGLYRAGLLPGRRHPHPPTRQSKEEESR